MGISFFPSAIGAQALMRISPREDTDDIDHAPVYLVQRLDAADGEPGTGAVLPGRFRDSPEVVAEFSAGGVDFVAGPGDMKLESRLLASGEAVWVTYYWDEERMAGFAVPAG